MLSNCVLCVLSHCMVMGQRQQRGAYKCLPSDVNVKVHYPVSVQVEVHAESNVSWAACLAS
jgi:hypothetical protein